MDLRDHAAATTGLEPVDANAELARLQAMCRRQGEALDGLGRRCATLRQGAEVLRSENRRLRAEIDRLLGTRARSGPPALPRRTPQAGEIPLPAEPRAAGAARIVLSTWLRDHAPATVIDDARLIVSELIANSLRDADVTPEDVLRLGIELRDGLVRVEVEDPGMHGVVAPRTPERDNGGFGLSVLKLAARWGVIRDGTTRVWAELAWPTEAQPAPA